MIYADSSSIRASIPTGGDAPATSRTNGKHPAKRVSQGCSALARIGWWTATGKKSLEQMMGEITRDVGDARSSVDAMGLREKRVMEQLSTGEKRSDIEQHPERLMPFLRAAVIEMAVSAASSVFEQGTYDGEPIRKDEIDLVIFCSVARAYCEPATAVVVQERLGLHGAAAFDLSNACLGFTDAWLVADSMIASGRIRNALLVTAEPASHIADICRDSINRGEDPRELRAGLSLGDGAVAAVVRARRPGSKEIALVAATRETFSRHHELCVLPDMYEPMLTRGRQLLAAGVKNIKPLAHSVLVGSQWSLAELDACIVHQVSMGFAENVMKAVQIPATTKKYYTFPEHGNMASASVPFTLGAYIESRGDWKTEKVLCLGFGSGLGVAALTLAT
jgi:3-oxoacyl-[acyl-carrier-protein] synthase III